MPRTKAAIYMRVSTKDQAEEGLSLDAQLAKLRSYCALRDFEIVAELRDEAVSGFKPLAKRPDGGPKLLELVRTKAVGAIVAWKLDRLFRNTEDCIATVRVWDAGGIALHFIDLGGSAVDTSSASGKFFITILAAMAELERNQTSERVTAIMRYKIGLNEFTGGDDPPYGYRMGADGKHLVPDKREQYVIEKARDLREKGLPLRGIAKALELAGHRSRKGRKFAPTQVARMLEHKSRVG